jgi:molecular chaperone DnaJ
MAKRDYYEILGLNKNATQSDIKKAYRKLAKEKHPDSGGNEDEFKEIAEAYSILSDEGKKTNYDRYGHNPPRGGFDSNFEDMFNHFGFGFNPRNEAKNRKGSDYRISIKLTLEEIFEGGTKKIKYNRKSACGTCNSVGGHGIKTCQTCDGRGVIIEHIRTPIGIMQNAITCHSCGGHGTTYTTTCGDCHGEGIINKDEVLEIKIPVGVQDGMSMTFAGLGQAIKNGTAGSLVVLFNEIPHNKFTRNGNDLKLNIKLPYQMLVLGGKVDLETIEKTKIKIKIPEFNNIGDTLRISGKGMRYLNSEHRGDLMLVLDIDMPKEIDDKTRELLENLKNINKIVVDDEKM